jgi:putative ABC transport system substrate-binding protein
LEDLGKPLYRLAPLTCLGALVIVLLLLAGCGTQGTQTTTTPSKTYKLGILQLIPHPTLDTFRKAAIQELAQKGFVEGKNLTIDYQNAQGNVNTAATIASKFVSDGDDAIFCITTPACIASAKATSTIPVVFGYVTDPIAGGLVTRLDHPGANVTGVIASVPVDGQMDLIRKILPTARTVGAIWNPGEPNSRSVVNQMKTYASHNGMTIIDANVSTSAEVSTAAKSLVGRVNAIFIPGDNTAESALPAVIQVCQTNKIPLFTADNSDVDQGTLAAYGFFAQDLGRQQGDMLARILGGQKPGNTNVEQPARFEVVVNLRAAQLMGVTIPDSVVQSAGRVVR